MITPTFELWQNFYNYVAGKSPGYNNNADGILELSRPNNDLSDAISNLISPSKSLVGIYFSNFDDKIEVFHGIANLGSSMIYNEPKIIALQGTKDKAIPIEFKVSSIFDPVSKMVPNLDDITELEDIVGLATLAVPAQEQNNEGELFETYPYMHLPPFLFNHFMTAQSMKPADLLLSTMQVIAEVETNDQTSFNTEDLRIRCKRLIFFLFLAAKGEMKPISVRCANENDQQAWRFCEHSHNEFLIPRQQDNQQPIANGTNMPHPVIPITDAIKESTEPIADVLRDCIGEVLLQNQQNHDYKKKSFNSLHQATQNLIRNASAIAFDTPAPVSDTCNEFFSSKTRGEARSHFTRTMSSKYNRSSLNVSEGTIVAIHSGLLLWSSSEEPSNFSVFNFPKMILQPNGIAPNSEKEALASNLKELYGQKLSTSEIEAVISQRFTLPNQSDAPIDFVKVTLGNFIAACRFFMGDNALLSQSLAKVLHHIESNILTYESLQLQDQKFGTKFLCSIDYQVQYFLKSCQDANSIEDVDFNFIDFSSLLTSIMLRRFSADLPWKLNTFFKSTTEKSNKRNPAESSENDKDREQKRQRPNLEKETAKRVTNDDYCTDWNVDLNGWNKCFAKSPPSERPQLNGKPICHRWFARNYCFNNCKQVDSHVGCSTIGKKSKESIALWFKEKKDKVA